jgi:hypothetical protein
MESSLGGGCGSGEVRFKPACWRLRRAAELRASPQAIGGAAQLLTRLHYQWLIVEGYLKGVCQPEVVSRIVDSRASHFFKFRAEYDARQPAIRLGNALPLEFSAAASRFGHSMVRAAHDHNNAFGRPNNPATFDLLFTFTGGGGMFGSPKLPKNWVIDWVRFVVANPPKINDGQAKRVARKIHTELAPPLGVMQKEGNNLPAGQLQDLFKHLARRNLRRGYNLRLPTGQAVHRYLRQHGAITSPPIEDVSTIFAGKPNMQDFLTNSGAKFHQRTPLWFYCLAEAEQSGGQSLGEVGSWLVASTIIGVLLSNPQFGAFTGFHARPESPEDDRRQPDRLHRQMDEVRCRDGVGA